MDQMSTSHNHPNGTNGTSNGHNHTRSRSPSPNRGATVPDTTAIGAEQEPLSAWRERCGIDVGKQVKLVKLSHMRYRHPDLGVITGFLRDFGMQVAKKTEDKVWYKGYGPDQYVYYAEKGPKEFLGGTFQVASYEDLEKATKLPNAGAIQCLDDAPGGGYLLTLHDPEGFPVNLVYGQAPAEVGEMPETLVVNTEADKKRVREFQRFKPGPAGVHKLGHFGLCVENFEAQVDFYTRNFNLVPSDFLYIKPPNDSTNGTNGTPSKKDVGLFARIDLGPTPVDHHSFFMTQTTTTKHIHHSSFEVHDFDTQNLGHQWLASKGYKSVWGIGRHILGSQIFDYWWDTSGFMIEHYADGDLVNEETPVGFGPAGDESLAVWGPEVPSYFLD